MTHSFFFKNKTILKQNTFYTFFASVDAQNRIIPKVGTSPPESTPESTPNHSKESYSEFAVSDFTPPKTKPVQLTREYFYSNFPNFQTKNTFFGNNWLESFKKISTILGFAVVSFYGIREARENQTKIISNVSNWASQTTTITSQSVHLLKQSNLLKYSPPFATMRGVVPGKVSGHSLSSKASGSVTGQGSLRTTGSNTGMPNSLGRTQVVTQAAKVQIQELKKHNPSVVKVMDAESVMDGYRILDTNPHITEYKGLTAVFAWEKYDQGNETKKLHVISCEVTIKKELIPGSTSGKFRKTMYVGDETLMEYMLANTPAGAKLDPKDFGSLANKKPWARDVNTPVIALNYKLKGKKDTPLKNLSCEAKGGFNVIAQYREADKVQEHIEKDIKSFIEHLKKNETLRNKLVFVHPSVGDNDIDKKQALDLLVSGLKTAKLGKVQAGHPGPAKWYRRLGLHHPSSATIVTTSIANGPGGFDSQEATAFLVNKVKYLHELLLASKESGDVRLQEKLAGLLHIAIQEATEDSSIISTIFLSELAIQDYEYFRIALGTIFDKQHSKIYEQNKTPKKAHLYDLIKGRITFHRALINSCLLNADIATTNLDNQFANFFDQYTITSVTSNDTNVTYSSISETSHFDQPNVFAKCDKVIFGVLNDIKGLTLSYTTARHLHFYNAFIHCISQGKNIDETAKLLERIGTELMHSNNRIIHIKSEDDHIINQAIEIGKTFSDTAREFVQPLRQARADLFREAEKSREKARTEQDLKSASIFNDRAEGFLARVDTLDGIMKRVLAICTPDVLPGAKSTFNVWQYQDFVALFKELFPHYGDSLAYLGMYDNCKAREEQHYLGILNSIVEAIFDSPFYSEVLELANTVCEDGVTLSSVFTTRSPNFGQVALERIENGFIIDTDGPKEILNLRKQTKKKTKQCLKELKKEAEKSGKDSGRTILEPKKEILYSVVRAEPFIHAGQVLLNQPRQIRGGSDRGPINTSNPPLAEAISSESALVKTLVDTNEKHQRMLHTRRWPLNPNDHGLTEQSAALIPLPPFPPGGLTYSAPLRITDAPAGETTEPALPGSSASESASKADSKEVAPVKCCRGRTQKKE